MCVEIERECEDSVVVTIRGNLGVAARTPLFDPWEDDEEGLYVFATDSVQLSLTDQQFQGLVDEARAQDHIDRCHGC
jgi:hypothetical protein